MTVLPAFEQAGQSFCVPSMALILLVQGKRPIRGCIEISGCCM